MSGRGSLNVTNYVLYEVDGMAVQDFVSANPWESYDYSDSSVQYGHDFYFKKGEKNLLLQIGDEDVYTYTIGNTSVGGICSATVRTWTLKNDLIQDVEELQINFIPYWEYTDDLITCKIAKNIRLCAEKQYEDAFRYAINALFDYVYADGNDRYYEDITDITSNYKLRF